MLADMSYRLLDPRRVHEEPHLPRWSRAIAPAIKGRSLWDDARRRLARIPRR